MIFGGGRVLGLAMGERSLLAAEVRLRGKSCEPVRAATFFFPHGVSLEDSSALGAALRGFLRAQQFSARKAVVGVPARWLLVKTKNVPPAEARALASLIRLEAERDFSTPLEDLVLDYLETDSGEAGRTVLVLAMPRRKLASLLAMVAAARLQVRAVVPSTLVAAVGRGDNSDAVRLQFTCDSAELVIAAGGRVRAIRYLGPLPKGDAPPAKTTICDWASNLAAHVGRLLAVLPRAQEVAASGVVIGNDAGLPPEAIMSVRDALGLPVCLAEDNAAMALGYAGAYLAQMPMDFLHSRLAPRKQPFLRRRLAWATALGVVLLLAGGSVFLSWQEEHREVTALRQRLEAMRPDLEATRSLIGRIAFARSWHDQRPQLLECLRELVLAFPAEGRIWATSLAVRDDMRGIVGGKASDERSVLEVLDRIKRNRAFSEVTLIYLRESSGQAGGSGEAGSATGGQTAGRSREVAYRIGFKFIGLKSVESQNVAARSKP